MTLHPHTVSPDVDTPPGDCSHRWTPWGAVGPDSHRRRDCLNCGTFEVVVPSMAIDLR